jgi:hypothetical protein
MPDQKTRSTAKPASEQRSAKSGEEAEHAEGHCGADQRGEVVPSLGRRDDHALRVVQHAGLAAARLGREGQSEDGDRERDEQHDVRHGQRVADVLGKHARYERAGAEAADVGDERDELCTSA